MDNFATAAANRRLGSGDAPIHILLADPAASASAAGYQLRHTVTPPRGGRHASIGGHPAVRSEAAKRLQTPPRH